MTTDPAPPDPDRFITRWRASDASELANAQSFLNDLIDLLGLDRPDPTHASGYRYEYPVTFPRTGTPGRIDLYKRGHFVLEAKRGAAPAAPSQLPLLPDAPPAGRGARPTWNDAMVRARGQAEAYARALPDEYPPFLVTVAVGQVIELYADFSRTGKNYTHFPDARRFRIHLDDLRDPDIRERLRLVWSDPDALDPARTAARVTREIAARLAALGRSFEAQGHPPDHVARFLMRCLFSMFAEDVRLIPENSFRDGRAAAPTAAPELALGEAAAAAGTKPAWPRALPEQMAAVRAALRDAGEAGPADIARRFRRARADTVRPLLETLSALGHARATGDGRFAA